MANLFAPAFPDPGSGDPGDKDLTGAADSSEYVMGTAFEVLTAGTITGVVFYVPTSNQPTNSEFGVGVFDISAGSAGGVLLVHDTVTAPTAGEAGTWKTYTLSTPVAAETGKKYRAAARTNRYAYSRFVFDAAAVTNGSIRGLQDNGPAGFPNGGFEVGPGAGLFPSPNSSFRAALYGIDVAVDFGATGTVAAALPGLTAAAAGAVTVAGSASAALPALTGAATGALAVAGAAALTLPALQAAFAGERPADGPLAAALPALTAALAGVSGSRTTPRASAGSTPRIAGGTTARL